MNDFLDGLYLLVAFAFVMKFSLNAYHGIRASMESKNKKQESSYK